MPKLLLLTFAFTTACTSTSLDMNGDDTGTARGAPDYLACDDTSTALAPGDVTTLGFSADDVVAALAAPVSATAAWTDGSGSTTVTISVGADGDPLFHDREPAADTGDTGALYEGPPDGPCADYLEVPVTVSFSTDDGAFAETLATSIWVTDLTNLSVGAPMDPDALGGTFTFTNIDPSEWDTVTLELSNSWSGGAIQGQVSMDASRQTSSDSGTSSGEGMVGPVLLWPPA